jgi:hypothetical protein
MKSEMDGINPAVEPSGTGCVECLALGGCGCISADAPNAGTSAAVGCPRRHYDAQSE